MIDIAPPSFLNLDVDVISEDDLTPIEEAIGEHGFVLGNQRVDGLCYLSFEPGYIEEPTPELCAIELVRLINSFNNQAKELWFNSKSRTFNFGFESGVSEPYYSSVLSVETLKGISLLEASIKITVYRNVETGHDE